MCTPFFKNGVKNGVHTLLLLEYKTEYLNFHFLMLIYKNGVKNGVSTLLLFDKNGVPQHSLFDVKSENGVKNGVHTLFYMIANFLQFLPGELHQNVGLSQHSKELLLCH